MPSPSRPLVYQTVAAPVPLLCALATAALFASVLPGGRWSDTLALLASTAALFAGHERRDRDMLAAAGLAAGLAPAGMLLAPLFVGLAVRRQAVRYLPLALLIGLAGSHLLPWPGLPATLPNLAALVTMMPESLALVVAAGIGVAAWLGARASMLAPATLFHEARLGVVVLAIIWPLPIGALAFVLMFAALPLPSPPRRMAANDNIALRRAIRLAA
jgi:hypothetical protein